MQQRRRLKFLSQSDANDLPRHSVSHDDAVRPTSAETAVKEEMEENDEQEKAEEQKDENQEFFVAELGIEQSALQRSDTFMHIMPTPIIGKKRQLTLHGTSLPPVEQSKQKRKRSTFQQHRTARGR